MAVPEPVPGPAGQWQGRPGRAAEGCRADGAGDPVVARHPKARRGRGPERFPPPVTIDREVVNAYSAVCGCPGKDTVPITYPHVLAFGLRLKMLTDPAFPVPVIGMVHVENSITQHRPIAIGETVEVLASIGPGKPHPKGTVFESVTTVRSGGTVVWESVSTRSFTAVRGDQLGPS